MELFPGSWTPGAVFILGVSVCAGQGAHNLLFHPFRGKSSVPVKLATVFSALFVIITIILILSQPAILSMLREIEIDRSITALNLDNVPRGQISAQLPEFLFETRFSWMVSSLLFAGLFILLSWLSILIADQWHSHWHWSVMAGVLLLDLLFFSWRFVEVLPLAEWRETYFPQTKLIRFLQEHAQGVRVLALDDAIGYPGLQHHPELRPNRLMHYRVESVRGYDPIILKQYTQFINRIYNLPPETRQGGLLFFPQPVESELFSYLNAGFIITTRNLGTPYELVYYEDHSPMKVYRNPNCKPRFFATETGGQITPEVNLSTHVI